MRKNDENVKRKEPTTTLAMAIEVDGGRTLACERDSKVTKSTRHARPGDLPAFCPYRVDIRRREMEGEKEAGELEFNPEIGPAFISKTG